MRTISFSTVSVLVAFIILCSHGWAAPKVLGPPAKEPWAATRSLAEPKVVYGDDDRVDVYDEADPERRAWAASTCALVDASQLSENGDGTFTLETFAYTVDGLPPCEGEPFADQPTAAFCTGFMVGTDLIATAGHCVDEASLDETRLIFGFEMVDFDSPVVVFAESQIYTPVEIVGSALSNSLDYAVLRVDRPIVAPDAQVLEIRRTGTIAVGANVGIIGHPWGLPVKIAFGENSVVRSNSPADYFITNLDTFGGNSGSPVFNAATGVVEGILVRGEVDFVVESTCFRANTISNTGGRGEDVTKSTRFADLVPGGRGEISFDRNAYRCSDTVTVSVSDLDLRGDGTLPISVTTVQGDQETVILSEEAVLGNFSATIPVVVGAVAPQNGTLDVAAGHSILAVYSDADNGQGTPAVVTVGAIVDCTPPAITNVRVERAGGISFVVAFETSEPATGIVQAGTSCSALDIEARGDFGAEHHVVVHGLEPETEYAFRVTAEDAAGNTASFRPAQGCLPAETGEFRDPFVEPFFDFETDLVGTSITFTPDASVSGYRACTVARTTLPSQASCGRRLLLGDDTHFEYVLPEGKTFTFYGVPYERMFIGSNGYVTFGQGDDTYEPSLNSHFSLPRISGYFSDLVPLGGNLLVKEFPDRVTITFDHVPDYYDDVHTFQIELFYTGDIRLTWLQLTDPYGVIGLSAGGGIPEEYTDSDLSEYGACDALLPNALCGDDSVVVCAASLTAGAGPRDNRGDLVAVGLAVVLMWAARRRMASCL